jgi:hypothetical protein
MSCYGGLRVALGRCMLPWVTMRGHRLPRWVVFGLNGSLVASGGSKLASGVTDGLVGLQIALGAAGGLMES